jgi:hypothetical protein
VFQPPTTEWGARAIIPLAHQVCDARGKRTEGIASRAFGDDWWRRKQAGHSIRSVAGQENAALDIVAGTTLAYRPTYNNDIGESRSCDPTALDAVKTREPNGR